MGSVQAVLPKENSSKSETEWPLFKDGDNVLPTEFKDGSLKCPYCHHWIVRIKQHLMTHLGEIQNWEDAEKFSTEVSRRKRKMLEDKRAHDPKRRREDPKRKETLTKADEKSKQRMLMRKVCMEF